MGAFYSFPSFPAPYDDKAEDLYFPPSSAAELLARCKSELQDLPRPYKRIFNRRVNRNKETPWLSKNQDTECEDYRVRILQWNILAQGKHREDLEFVDHFYNLCIQKYISPFFKIWNKKKIY